jgi:HD-GYP domain-containing protein (c-di-GMP phosphodiesterase class II)
MRLAELMGTLSLATDAGMGMPVDHGLRSAAMAVRVGEVSGASDAARADAFYVALVRYMGCTSESNLAAHVMGDEIAVRGALYGVDWGAPAEVMGRMARAVGRGKRPIAAAAAAARTIAKMPKLFDSALAHCEVGDRLAQSIGFDEGFRAALFHSFERWDGKGCPRRVKGEAIPLSARLALVGEEIELGHRLGGVEGARNLLKKRAGRGLDPGLVEAFDAQAAKVCASLEAPSAWTVALELEPGARREIGEEQVDEVLTALAHFADLKSRFTRAHAIGVADLARRAARAMRLGEKDERTLARAALVHDLGRVAVSAAVWDKPGPLTDPEWEQVRMHTYVGERILSRASGLAAVAEVATLAHERLDGRGYHRKLSAASCGPLARILAAADVYHALTEARAQRPARGADEAAAELESLARSGTLCPEAVAAVLGAAGQGSRLRRDPSGLTDREVQVLRLVARGLTNKEVAAALDISVKTAGNHLQSIFEKIGVTTRAAASMFAMQKGLVS